MAVTAQEKLVRALLTGVIMALLWATFDLGSKTYAHIFTAACGSVAISEVLMWLFEKVKKDYEKRTKA